MRLEAGLARRVRFPRLTNIEISGARGIEPVGKTGCEKASTQVSPIVEKTSGLDAWRPASSFVHASDEPAADSSSDQHFAPSCFFHVA